MRKAFSLITAIFIMVLMSTLALFILNLSAKVTKETSAQYYQEQAALLARSYTELAVMAVINHNRNSTNCVENINGKVEGIKPGETPTGSINEGSGYKVETRIYYLGNTLPCSNSRELTDSAAHSGTTITTNYGDVTGSADALAAIIVDVYVQYRDPGNLNQWVTFHRRSLQKI